MIILMANVGTVKSVDVSFATDKLFPMVLLCVPVVFMQD